MAGNEYVGVAIFFVHVVYHGLNICQVLRRIVVADRSRTIPCSCWVKAYDRVADGTKLNCQVFQVGVIF